MEGIGKALFVAGAVVAGVGLVLWLAGGKLGWIGQLPGDIRIVRPGFRVYVPLTTMVLLSLLVSLAVWLYGKFLR